MTTPIHVPAPETVAASRMTAFAAFCAEREGDPDLRDDDRLAAFACAQPGRFWRHLLDHFAPTTGGSPEPTLLGDTIEDARFFPNLTLSYAGALLAERPEWPEDAVALTSLGEESGAEHITRADLRREVARVAAGLAARGLGPGDRVVALARNHADTAIACLATAACGATWSAVGPDMAADAALSRFVPLAPKLLLVHPRWHNQGRAHDLADKVAALEAGLPSVEAVLLLDAMPEADAEADPFPLRPFDHPLFVLFSSGTTGPPKCIVHGQGGTLLEHLKELALHADLGPGDALYYHTSPAWLMWNWQLSALGVGARVVLYDGAVSWPERDTLLTLLSTEGVSVFGTSPPYLQYLQDGGIPVPAWPALRGMLSTGSILYDRQYDFVREAFGDVPLQSISGGTDIVGCFVLGHPNRPVYPGECSSISLGYDVQAMTDDGPTTQGTGELVCVGPFPSRPVGLHDDPNGQRFHAAWFADHEGLWTHGDFLTLTDRGTARMLGRSDGVLNVRGVRIGPAEIYQVVGDFQPVAEAMAIDQAWPRAIGGRRLVLLVVMKPGQTLGRPLTLKLKKALRDRRSMAHVPDVVVEVDALPTTLTGKRSERSASDALNGREVRNRSALANPESLDALVAMCPPSRHVP